MILPLALVGVLTWRSFAAAGELRLYLAVTVLPGICVAIVLSLFSSTTRRLLHPPDVGSEGNEVVDLEEEAHQAVGLVIQRDQFPDRLFAPAKRTDAVGRRRESGLRQGNAERDFRQGTLMLRAGDSGEHVPGDSADGRVPVRQARLGAVVHLLRGAVQHAGRPGVFRRQRHQRAGTANARSAADDDHLAVANSVGKA